ncbi:MAG: hypothetical protein AAGF49_01455 [Pseudomonadota bacterium]
MHGFIIALLSAVVATSAMAQSDADGRFQIEPLGEDVLRLDKITGEVQICANSNPTFACRVIVERAVPLTVDAPASGAILAENAALKAENRALKERLAMIAALVDDVDRAELARVRGNGAMSDDIRREIDEAVEVTDYAVRRFRDVLRAFGEGEGR